MCMYVYILNTIYYTYIVCALISDGIQSKGNRLVNVCYNLFADYINT